MRAFHATMCALAAVVFLGVSGAGATDETIQSFDGATSWLNSAPLTPAQLRGKVVLVDFWEYTCLNCLRTLPYLRTWYKRYHNDGLVIVGVHTPEFQFSGQPDNVAAAVKRLEVTWPVALDDNHRAIWNRYGNDVWPHELLYDQQGRLVESVRGEGGYPQTERKIQTLLRRENPRLSLPPVMALLPQDNYDKPGAVCYPHTPELIVGYDPPANAPLANTNVSNHLSNGPGAQSVPFGSTAPMSDAAASGSGSSAIAASGSEYYSDPSNHRDGALYLQGTWTRSPDGVVSAAAGGYAALNYRAIVVEAVMRPVDTSAVRVNVTQDGKPIPQGDAGNDLHYDAGGTSYVTVDAARAYQLVNNAQFGHYELRLAPQGSGLGVYDFDFESCEIPASK